jgi:hypothetical protein
MPTNMPTNLVRPPGSRVATISSLNRADATDTVAASLGPIVRVVAVLIVLALGALVEVAAESSMDPQYWVNTDATLMSP